MKNYSLIAASLLMSISAFADTSTFTRTGKGTTYLEGKSGCSEALDRATSSAKNACYTNGFTECAFVSSQLIVKKKAIKGGSFNNLGSCSFEVSVLGSELDSTKAEDENERRN